MSLKAVPNYLRNLTRSVEYAAADVAGELLPDAISEFTENNKEFAISAYSALRNPKSALKKQITSIQNSKIYQSLDYGVRNTFEDLRTGKFYNKERMMREEDNYDMFDNIDFNDIIENNYSDEPSFDETISISSGDRKIVDAIEGSNAAAANSTISAVLASSEAQMKNARANVGLLYTQNEKLFGGLHKDLSAIGTTIDAIGKITSARLSNIDSNISSYFTESLKLNIERNAMLKEILEIQRNMYKTAAEKEREAFNKRNESRKEKKNTWNDIQSSGIPDLRAFFNNAKNNITNELGMLFSLPTEGLDATIREAMASPLKSVMTGAIRAIIPSTVKAASKELNESLSGLFAQAIARMQNSNDSSSVGIGDLLSRIFGVKINANTKVDTSRYEKGAIPFDGITRKAIIDVIPGYLSRIESYLTGGSERYFDYNTGKWTTMSSIRNRIADINKDTVNIAMANIRNQVGDVPGKLKAASRGDERKQESLMAAWSEFSEFVLERNGIVNLNQSAAANRVDRNKYPNLYDNFKIICDMIRASGVSQVNINGKEATRYKYSSEINMARDVIEAKQWQDSKFRSIEDGLNVLQQYYESLDLDKTKNRDAFTGGAFNGLLATEDEYGNTVFNYLQNINKELVWQRQNFVGFGRRSSGNGVRLDTTGRKSRSINDIDITNPDLVEYRQEQSRINASRLAAAREATLREIEKGDATDIRKILDNPDTNEYFENLIELFQSGNSKDFMLELESFNEGIIASWFNKNIRKERIATINDKGNVTYDNFISDVNEPKEKTFLKSIYDTTLGKITNASNSIFGSLGDEFTRMLYSADKAVYEALFKYDIKDKSDGTKYEGFLDYLAAKVDKKLNPDEDKNNIVNKVKNNEKVKDFWSRTKASMSDIKDNAIRYAKDTHKEVYGPAVKKVLDEIGVEIVRNEESSSDIEGQATGSYRGSTFKGISALSKGEAIINKYGTGIVNKTGVYNVSTPSVIMNAQDTHALGLTKERPDSISESLRKEKIAANRMGFNIASNASGTTIKLGGRDVNVDDIKTITGEAKNLLPEGAAGGIIGGLASALLGLAGGPLVGMAVGAGTNMIRKSDNLKNFLFGTEVDESGKRTGNGGILGTKVTGIINKYLPNIAKYAVAGIIPGLISPFGIVGGMTIGAGVGLLKSTEGLKEKLFGEEGLIGNTEKDILKSFKGKFKTIGIGTGIGALAGKLLIGGKLGILGGAAVGLAGSLLKSGSDWKDALFGAEVDGKRSGGLFGALQEAVSPLTKIGSEIKNQLADAIKVGVTQPLQDFLVPFIHEIPYLLKDKLDNFSKTKIGKNIERAIHNTLGRFSKFVSGKITSLTGGIFKTLTLPGRAIGKVGRNIRSRQIKRGRADYMTAKERIDFMAKEGKVYDDDYNSDLDKIMAGIGSDEGISIDDAKQVQNLLGVLMDDITALEGDRKRAGNDILNTLKDFDAGGNRVSSSTYKAIRKAINKGEIDKVPGLLSKGKLEGGSTINQEQYNTIMNGMGLNDQIRNYNKLASTEKFVKNYNGDTDQDMDTIYNLMTSLGFKGSKEELFGNKRNLRNLYRYFGTDIARAEKEAADPETIAKKAQEEAEKEKQEQKTYRDTIAKALNIKDKDSIPNMIQELIESVHIITGITRDENGNPIISERAKQRMQEDKEAMDLADANANRDYRSAQSYITRNTGVDGTAAKISASARPRTNKKRTSQINKLKNCGLTTKQINQVIDYCSANGKDFNKEFDTAVSRFKNFNAEYKFDDFAAKEIATCSKTTYRKYKGIFLNQTVINKFNRKGEYTITKKDIEFANKIWSRKNQFFNIIAALPNSISAYGSFEAAYNERSHFEQLDDIQDNISEPVIASNGIGTMVGSLFGPVGAAIGGGIDTAAGVIGTGAKIAGKAIGGAANLAGKAVSGVSKLLGSNAGQALGNGIAGVGGMLGNGIANAGGMLGGAGGVGNFDETDSPNDGIDLVHVGNGDVIGVKQTGNGEVEPDSSNAHTKAILDKLNLKEKLQEKAAEAQVKISEMMKDAVSGAGETVKKNKWSLLGLLLAGSFLVKTGVLQQLFNNIIKPLAKLAWENLIKPAVNWIWTGDTSGEGSGGLRNWLTTTLPEIIRGAKETINKGLTQTYLTSEQKESERKREEYENTPWWKRTVGWLTGYGLLKSGIKGVASLPRNITALTSSEYYKDQNATEKLSKSAIRNYQKNGKTFYDSNGSPFHIEMEDGEPRIIAGYGTDVSGEGTGYYKPLARYGRATNPLGLVRSEATDRLYPNTSYDDNSASSLANYQLKLSNTLNTPAGIIKTVVDEAANALDTVQAYIMTRLSTVSTFLTDPAGTIIGWFVADQSTSNNNPGSSKSSTAINSAKAGSTVNSVSSLVKSTNTTASSGGLLSRVGSSIKNFSSKVANFFGFGKGTNEYPSYGLGYYKQNDPSIAGIRYNAGFDNEYQTIGDSGCGPAAAVNAIEAAYGRGNPVLSAADYALSHGYKERNGGTTPGFFGDYFARNGLSSQTTSNRSQLMSNIRAGVPTVLMGSDRNGVSSKTPYGASPHYVTATGVDSRGHVIIQDPESKYDNQLYSLNDVLSKTSFGVSAFGKHHRYGRGKSKIIIVGDSRTVQMRGSAYGWDDLLTDHFEYGSTTNDGIIWVCHGGMGLSWMQSTAIPTIEDQIDSNTALVINIGINGLEGNGMASYLSQKVPQWTSKGADVYFCTCIPCTDEMPILADAATVEFNNTVTSSVSGMKIIDCYSQFAGKISYNDYAHFTSESNIQLLNFILNAVRTGSGVSTSSSSSTATKFASKSSSSTGSSNSSSSTVGLDGTLVFEKKNKNKVFNALASSSGNSGSNNIFSNIITNSTMGKLMTSLAGGKGKFGKGKYGRGVTANENAKMIWWYLKQCGMSDIGAAAIMGNIANETGYDFNPGRAETSYMNQYGWTSEGYTKSVDDGSYSREQFMNDAIGYGLVGYTYWSLKRDLYDLAKSTNRSIGSLSAQSEYLVQSAKNDGVWDKLINATDIQDATSYFMLNYERPYDQSWAQQVKRGTSAQELYDQLKGTSGIEMDDANVIYGSDGSSGTNSNSNNEEETESKSSGIFGMLSDIISNSKMGKLMKSLLGTSDSSSSNSSSSSNTNNTLVKTGDSVKDVLAVAENELGYYGKASNSQLEDKTANKGGKYTKYGVFTGTNGLDWCASFVSWVLDQAGVGSVAPKTAWAPTFYDSGSNSLLKGYGAASINPENAQPGDIITFSKTGNSGDDIYHVGFVRSNDGSTLTTIEGNTRGTDGYSQVYSWPYNLATIDKTLFVARPQYPDSKGSTTDEDGFGGSEGGTTDTGDESVINTSEGGAFGTGGNFGKPLAMYGQYKNSLYGRGIPESNHGTVHVKTADNRINYVPKSTTNLRKAGYSPNYGRGNYYGTGVVDYSGFIEAIIKVLYTIADNTDKLNLIVSILNSKLNLDITPEDVSNNTSNGETLKQKIQTALLGVNNATSSTSKLNSAADDISDTSMTTIIRAMNAIASE